jgi:hypothetical protein
VNSCYDQVGLVVVLPAQLESSCQFSKSLVRSTNARNPSASSPTSQEWDLLF